MRQSQHEKILELLRAGDWVCSSRFYAAFIADPRTRICELKKKGYMLESRKCETHDHAGGSKEWRMTGYARKQIEKSEFTESSKQLSII